MRTSTQLAAMVAFLALGSYSAAAGEAGFLGGIDIGFAILRYFRITRTQATLRAAFRASPGQHDQHWVVPSSMSGFRRRPHR